MASAGDSERDEIGRIGALQRRRPRYLTASIERPVSHSPTFVLVDEGREVGRIEGYPGEAFCWGLLDELLAKLPGPTLVM